MGKINPYTRLLKEIKEFCRELNTIKSQQMCVYTLEQLKEQGWDLFWVYERVGAAQQLGYKVELRYTDERLELWYVLKPRTTPWQWS